MNCPKCSSEMTNVEVKIASIESKAKSYQCPKCDYFEFDPESSRKIFDQR